jgi:hypothetical protein
LPELDGKPGKPDPNFEMRRHDTYCSNFSCTLVTLAVFASWSAARDGSAEQSFKTGDKVCRAKWSPTSFS